MKVGILGCGSWGVTVASLLGRKEIETLLWCREAGLAQALQNERHHPSFAPQCELPKSVTVSSTLEDVVAQAEVLLFIVPSKAMSEVAEKAALYAKKDVLVVSFAKGFEEQTFRRMSEVLEGKFALKSQRVGVVSGPNHAEEIILGQPAATLAASKQLSTAEEIQSLLMGPSFRVYTSTDLVGAEIGGALKNIIALAVGIAAGLGLGDNAKAALMTRGLAEIARLGVALGAHPMTFTGLSGVGDLIATCTSEHSRNYRAGKILSQGKTAVEAEREIGMVVEGIRSVEAALFLARKKNVAMPITESMHRILNGQATAVDVMEQLMGRAGIQEAESYYFQN